VGADDAPRLGVRLGFLQHRVGVLPFGVSEAKVYAEMVATIG
jgi:hypothetical protein